MIEFLPTNEHCPMHPFVELINDEQDGASMGRLRAAVPFRVTCHLSAVAMPTTGANR